MIRTGTTTTRTTIISGAREWVDLLLEHFWKIIIALLIIVALVFGLQDEALQWAKEIIVPLIKGRG